MPIPAGVHVAWPGAAGAIPPGWSRQGSLDSRHVRGAASGADPGAIGGAATHTHSNVTAHTHALAAHTHISAETGQAIHSPSFTNAGAPTTDLNSPHAHPSNATGVDSGDTVAAVFGAWAATNSDPATLTVCWVQSDGTPTGLPPYGLVYWNTTTPPAGWRQHPATKAAYLKGAAPGEDGGAALNASTHTHTGAGTHTHGASSGHTHAGATTLAADTGSNTGALRSGAGVQGPTVTHTHTQAAATATATTAAATIGVSGSDAYEPPYYVLAVIQNSSGVAQTPVGVICVWIGTLASIPSGWLLCDGSNSTPDLRQQFVRGATSDGSGAPTGLGTTGGTLGHSHPSGGRHTHTADHLHGLTIGNESDGGVTMGSGSSNDALSTHTHDVSVSGAATPNTTDAGTSVDATATTDTRPLYYDVAFIQYQATGTVSVTTPAAASVQALPSFLAAWTLSGGRTQATYHVVIYANDGVTVVYDSSVVTSATQTATIPDSYLQNNASYKFQVTTVDTNSVVSVSSVVNFTTAWTDPNSVGGLTLSPVGGS